MESIYSEIMRELDNGELVSLVSEYKKGIINKRVEKDVNNGLSYYCDNNGTLILSEQFIPKPRLIILGAGHIALSLCEIASKIEFSVVVCDDRLSFANVSRFPDAKNIICDSFENSIQKLNINKYDYVTILTRGHRHDFDCLNNILAGQLPHYIGMIGSKRRVAIIRQMLIEQGFDKDIVDRLSSPIGLNIGALTPEEIAVSIVAQLIQCKRKGDFILNQTEQKHTNSEADIEAISYLANNQIDGFAVLVTVIDAKGSVPRNIGAKMLVIPNENKIIGSIGGGCAEADVLRIARDIDIVGGFKTHLIDMTDTAEQDGMVCGGSMKVLIERI